MKVKKVLLVAGVLILTSQGVLAQQVTELSRIPLSEAYSLELKDDIVYLGEGVGIRVIKDYTNPQEIGPLLFLPDGVTDLKIVGDNKMLAANGYSGFKVVDISDPTSLRITQTLLSEEGTTWTIYINQEKAYVGVFNTGVVELDISNPSMVSELSRCTELKVKWPWTIAGKKEGEDLYLYVGGGTYSYPGLSILKRSANSFVEVNFITGGKDGLGAPEELMVKGNLLLIANRCGFLVMDITNPENPVLLSEQKSIALRRAGAGLALSTEGNIVYLADGTNGVKSFDISNPRSPVLKGVYSIGKTYVTAEKLKYFEGRIYSLGTGWGLRVLDASDPSNLTLLGYYNTGGQPYGAYYYQENLLVHTNQGLWQVGISNPTSPRILGLWAPENLLWSLGFQGKDAVAVSEDSLWVLDFSVFPPIIKGKTNLYWRAPKKVKLHGNYVYVITWYGEWVEIFDISVTPPVRRGAFRSPFGNAITDIALSGHWMFLTSAGILYQVDISSGDPNNFRLVSMETNRIPGSWIDVVAVQDSLVAVGDHHLELFKATGTGLSHLGFYQFIYPSGAITQDIEIGGNYTFLSIQYKGLQVMDIKDPSNIKPISSFYIRDWSGKIAFANDSLVVLHNYTGVWLLKFTPPTPVESDKERPEIPERFSLSQNYPNPFNVETTIEFSIPPGYEGLHQVDIRVFNVLGQEVAILGNETKAVGFYRVKWNGKDKNGREAPSGTYIYRLIIGKGKFVSVKKMILLR